MQVEGFGKWGPMHPRDLDGLSVLCSFPAAPHLYTIGALINKARCLIDIPETTMLCSFQMLMQFGDDLPYGSQAIRQSGNHRKVACDMDHFPYFRLFTIHPSSDPKLEAAQLHT